MNKTIHLTLQSFLVFGQAVAGPAVEAFMLSGAWANLIHAVLGGMQMALAVWAHASNPDGTPASVAYLPKPKE